MATPATPSESRRRSLFRAWFACGLLRSGKSRQFQRCATPTGGKYGKRVRCPSRPPETDSGTDEANGGRAGLRADREIQSRAQKCQPLVQIAGIYQSTHQFKEAADYFGKALKIAPKNVSVRTQMASCRYYSDDVDGAVNEVNQALNPKDAHSLFNLGMIK